MPASFLSKNDASAMDKIERVKKILEKLGIYY